MKKNDDQIYIKILGILEINAVGRLGIVLSIAVVLVCAIFRKGDGLLF